MAQRKMTDAVNDKAKQHTDPKKNIEPKYIDAIKKMWVSAYISDIHHNVRRFQECPQRSSSRPVSSRLQPIDPSMSDSVFRAAISGAQGKRPEKKKRSLDEDEELLARAPKIGVRITGQVVRQ